MGQPIITIEIGRRGVERVAFAAGDSLTGLLSARMARSVCTSIDAINESIQGWLDNSPDEKQERRRPQKRQ